MIYDQIITKRLHAIIERNQEMKESILKKVDLSDGHKYDADPEDKEIQVEIQPETELDS